jgi:hypothetical protein
MDYNPQKPNEFEQYYIKWKEEKAEKEKRLLDEAMQAQLQKKSISC